MGNDCDVTHWPDHFAPMTWHRCLTAACDARVDPWEHSHYCPAHRAPSDDTGEQVRARRREVARAIVDAHRPRVSA